MKYSNHIPHSVNRASVFAVAAIFLGLASTANAARVSVDVPENETYVGLPTAISITIADASSHEPPTIPEINGAELKSNGISNTNSSVIVINGHMQKNESVRYTWTITPTRAGTIEIPVIRVVADGQIYETRPKQLIASASETGDLLAVEIAGSREHVYVGEPIELTLSIFAKPYEDETTGVRLAARDMWSLIRQDSTRWGVFSESLQRLASARQPVSSATALRPDASGEPIEYYRYDIPATIYPDRSGTIDTDDIRIVAMHPTRLETSRDPFSYGRLVVGGARPVVATAETPNITVKAVPTVDRPADYRGAVGHYTIATHAMQTDVEAGNPITLQIAVSGDGPLDRVAAPPLDTLEELTRDFHVPSGPLAGVVRDGMKIFTASIRPKRAGIETIPPIGLTSFDPQSETFVTTYSQPIPVEVRVSERLSANEVAGGTISRPAAPTSESTASNARSIRSERMPGDVLVKASPASPWPIATCYAAVPAFALLAMLAPWLASRWRCRAWSHQHARRHAERLLRKAGSVQEVTAALLAYAADRVGRPRDSLTPGEAVERLRQRGIRRGLDTFAHVLAVCEHARYAPFTTADPPVLIRQAQLAIRSIEAPDSKDK